MNAMEGAWSEAMGVAWGPDSPLAESGRGAHDFYVKDDWRTSSDADLRALGRAAEDPEALERWIRKALRRGELPEVGRSVVDLPSELRAELAEARVQEGRCSWCAGAVHRLRTGERACCCQDCFLEVGSLCLECPKRKHEA